MGIIQLHRAYGSLRLNNACKIALYADTYSYRRICNILKNKIDETLIFDQENQDKSHIPNHDNLRGASTYK